METKEFQEKVEIALNSMRPFLQADGGDVELIQISDDFEVFLKLTGNCSQCDMSHFTLKAGIENGLRSALPQISKVTAV